MSKRNALSYAQFLSICDWIRLNRRELDHPKVKEEDLPELIGQHLGITVVPANIKAIREAIGDQWPFKDEKKEPDLPAVGRILKQLNDIDNKIRALEQKEGERDMGKALLMTVDNHTRRIEILEREDGGILEAIGRLAARMNRLEYAAEITRANNAAPRLTPDALQGWEHKENSSQQEHSEIMREITGHGGIDG